MTLLSVGVPKEIKPQEYRVGLVPWSVKELAHRGCTIFVEKNAGLGIGISDHDYIAAGAIIVDSAAEIFEKADLVVKVKEPQHAECIALREGQILFTFLHLAADPIQTDLLLQSGATAIAYETVTAADGSLPLLMPMSQVAGRMSLQAAAHCLESAQGGSGILLGGVPGVAPGVVLVLGAGVVGSHAVTRAVGMGAEVIVLDHDVRKLRQMDDMFHGRVKAIYATSEAIEHYIRKADVVIGAVLIPGAMAPQLVTKNMLSSMRAGSVLVDVAIDQGGCFETSKPTTHENPTFIMDNIVHYCVSNMPGAVPRTASFALNNVTLPFVIKLATQGMLAVQHDEHLREGVNIHAGQVINAAVADALHRQPASLLI